MAIYKKILNPFTNQVESVVLIEENKYIPFDNNNRDYQEYLEWVEEGNVPEEPDTNNGGGE